MKRASWIAGLLCLLLGSATAKLVEPPAAVAELLWDRWGVPHIFAADEPSLFHAYGWAQAHSHGDLLLRLYGEARGRAAEYWGEAHLDSDRWVLINGVPERATRWLAQQTPEFRRNLVAFAAGINAYAQTYPERVDPGAARVLPVSAVDVLAHLQRVIYFSFVTDAERALDEAGGEENVSEEKGSNAWAIGPARAAGGNAMLLANPHLPWSDLHLFYEAQLQAPGVDIYGVSLVGVPVIAIGFNAALGWTHTVNPLDAADVYRLERMGEGYRWEGSLRAFDEETRLLKIRQPDGQFREHRLRRRSSVHGPVIRETGDVAYALRVAGLERAGLAEQWWSMAKAQSLGDFQAALARLQLPMFNVLYADRDGHILYVYNGLIPRRRQGDWATWRGAVEGGSVATLWQALHRYEELPQVLDPRNHWLQNANDPPWQVTLPSPLRANSFPPYFAPQAMGLRAQRSAKLVAANERISFDELIRDKHSTRVELADRVLDPLLAASGQGSPLLRDAARVLSRWDRHTDADSRGAVLFLEWAQDMGFFDDNSAELFATRWNPDQALSTPSGLADPQRAAAVLETVAARLRAAHGALDVKWGDLVRLRRGRYDEPSNGGPGALGIYRVLNVRRSDDGRYTAVHGDSFVAAIEFSDPPRAQALLAYGNASQPGSPHLGDQLPLFSRKQLRPVWRTRAEIGRHLAKRETLVYPRPTTAPSSP